MRALFILGLLFAPALHAQYVPHIDKVSQLESFADKKPDSEELQAKFERLFPAIHRALSEDRKAEDIQGAWGESYNFDEGVKKTIVRNAIIDLLLNLAGAPERDGKVVHAGIEHTYGYLLSNLITPFGYKRERWTSGEIERGVGLSVGAFGLAPSEGTLLANVTYFLGNIAFGKFETKAEVAKEVRNFKYEKLSPVRVVEKWELKRTELTVFTDLVPFRRGAEEKNTHLLIYSYRDSREDGPRLVTAFPVNQSFVNGLVAEEKLGPSQGLTLKYNAHIEGIKSGRGSRTVER